MFQYSSLQIRLLYVIFSVLCLYLANVSLAKGTYQLISHPDYNPPMIVANLFSEVTQDVERYRQLRKQFESRANAFIGLFDDLSSEQVEDQLEDQFKSLQQAQEKVNSFVVDPQIIDKVKHRIDENGIKMSLDEKTFYCKDRKEGGEQTSPYVWVFPEAVKAEIKRLLKT